MADAILKESRRSPSLTNFSYNSPELVFFEPLAQSTASNNFVVSTSQHALLPQSLSFSYVDHQPGDVSEPLYQTSVSSSFIVTPMPIRPFNFGSQVYVTTYTYSDGEELTFGESNNQQSSAGPQESWHFS